MQILSVARVALRPTPVGRLSSENPPQGVCASDRALIGSLRRVSLVGIAAVFVTGCATTPAPQNADPDDASVLFGGGAAGGVSGSQPQTDLWVVSLGAVPGAADAEAIAADIRSSTRLSDLRVETRDGRQYIVTGGFLEPNDEAKALLRRVRTIEIDGARPFSGAVLLYPETRATSGPGSEHDLRNAGVSGAPRYTLQVAAFGVPEGEALTVEKRSRFRRAAKNEAARLRAQGENAYFLHGPQTSVVTVGVYRVDEIDLETQPPFTPRHGPALTAAIKRFPAQTYNGETRTRNGGSQGDRPLPPVIIEVPAP